MVYTFLLADGGAADEDLAHAELVQVVVGGDGEVGVVGGGPELVARHHEEHERRHLPEHLVKPLVLKREVNLCDGTSHRVCITNYYVSNERSA